MHRNAPTAKVFYRPLEASIRWAGLLQFEQMILASVSTPREFPDSLRCPRLEELRLCTERIYDGILNRELPFGQNGVTRNDPSLLDAPDLTVRHTDLKCWMRTHYPEHRPKFLFCRSERIAHPIITVELGQAMLVERRALQSALEQCRSELRALQEEHEALRRQSPTNANCDGCPISDRAETTYLNIIGAMLDLLLGRSPSGTPYSSFRTQDAVVSALVAHHGGVMGIAERTLHGKFAAARRQLHGATV